jgi:hypothetical protein
VTDVALRKAKPREKSYKLSDGGGLHLFIKPNGAKLWRLKYRNSTHAAEVERPAEAADVRSTSEDTAPGILFRLV